MLSKKLVLVYDKFVNLFTLTDNLMFKFLLGAYKRDDINSQVDAACTGGSIDGISTDKITFNGFCVVLYARDVDSSIMSRAGTIGGCIDARDIKWGKSDDVKIGSRRPVGLNNRICAGWEMSMGSSDTGRV
jgi:hypothetical protein